MKRLAPLPLIFLAGAAFSQSFSHDLSNVRLASNDMTRVRKSKAVRAKGTSGQGVRILSNVTDAVTWKGLLERAMTKPTKTQTAKVGDTTYKIYIVTGKGGVNGQDCPEGTKPENALFVSKAVEGTGKALYPVRVSVVCRGESGVRDSFSLNADWDGKILDVALYNGSLGLTVHPTHEPDGPGAAEPSSLDLFLARLVKQFIEAP
jgi:hypothetical protein